MCFVTIEDDLRQDRVETFFVLKRRRQEVKKAELLIKTAGPFSISGHINSSCQQLQIRNFLPERMSEVSMSSSQGMAKSVSCQLMCGHSRLQERVRITRTYAHNQVNGYSIFLTVGQIVPMVTGISSFENIMRRRLLLFTLKSPQTY